MADSIESFRWTINKPVCYHCLFYAALIVKSNHNQNWGYSNSTDGLRHSATLPGRINLDDDVAKLEKSAGHLHLKGSIKIKSLEGKRRRRISRPNQKSQTLRMLNGKINIQSRNASQEPNRIYEEEEENENSLWLRFKIKLESLQRLEIAPIPLSIESFASIAL